MLLNSQRKVRRLEDLNREVTDSLTLDKILVRIQGLAPFVGKFQEIRPIFPNVVNYLQFEKGYGIIENGHILEIGDGELFKDNKENYYFGFGEYYVKEGGILKHLYTNESFPVSFFTPYKEDFYRRLKGIQEIPRNLFKREKKEGDPDWTFIGVDEREMAFYQEIITTESNMCGTYASAVLFSYLQDHNKLFLPTILRKKNSNDFSLLIDKIKKMVQPFPLPTVPVEIAFGYRRFFKHYHMNPQITFQSFGAEATLKSALNDNLPALLGILRIFGSSYGNHWVVPYSYCENDGTTYYKIHDNWGNYRKIIAATAGNGLVTLKNRIV